MSRRTLRRTSLALLIVLFVISTIVLGTNMKFESMARGQDEEDMERDNITINAYLVIMPDEENQNEQLQYCKDAEIDLISHVYFAPKWAIENHTKEKYLSLMAAAESYGMKVLTRDVRLQKVLSMSDDELRAFAMEYKDLPGFGGFYVVDEPGNPNPYAHVENVLRSVCPEAIVSVNFLPRGAYGEGTYIKQLTDYGSLIERKGTLSLDTYNFNLGGGVDEYNLFKNYDDMRIAGLRTGNDTSVYVQSIGLEGNYRRPSPSDLRYNMMSAIAYGMKELKFFAWCTPHPDEGNYTDGIIGRDYKPTDLYYEVCKINNKIHNFGEYLASCDAAEVYHSTQATPNAYQVIPENFFVKSSSNVIVSLFKERSGSAQYLMVVNKDYNNTQNVTLEFNDLTGLTEINGNTGEAETLIINDGTVSRSMAAGDSMLFLLPNGNYSSEIAEDKNLAKDAEIFATSSEGMGDLYLYNINDGAYIGNGARLRSNDGSAQYVTLDLGSVKDINRIDMAPSGFGPVCGAYYPSSFDFSVSKDGINWTKVVEKTNMRGILRTVPVFRFNAVSARYVKLTVGCFSEDNILKFCDIGEIAIYNDDGTVEANIATAYKNEIYQAGQNIALNKPVVAYSSSYDAPVWGCQFDYINDGNYATVWAGGMYANDGPDADEWTVIDLLGTYDIGKVNVFTSVIGSAGLNVFPDDYEIQVSEDGITFTTVCSRVDDNTPQSQETRVLTFPVTKARYVKFLATKLTKSNNSFAGYAIELCEIEVYGEPSEGKPCEFGENYAAGKTVHSVSSSLDVPAWGCDRTYINDGNKSTVWAGQMSVHFEPEAEEWIVIDLGELKTINTVMVVPSLIGANGITVFPVDYDVSVSTDGAEFTTVKSVTDDNDQKTRTVRVLSFVNVEARYVRFRATKLSMTNNTAAGYGIEIADVEVYNVKHNMCPWEIGATAHSRSCSCGANVETGSHSGGSASCTDKAVCEICSASYGEYAAHETEWIPPEKPADDKPGCIGHWYCHACSKYFSDEQCQHEISGENVIIPYMGDSENMLFFIMLSVFTATVLIIQYIYTVKRKV